MRLVWAFLAAVAVFVGLNLAGALHELGHVAATLVLGGTVHGAQFWYFRGGTQTFTTGLSEPRAAIMVLCGSLTTNGLGVLAVLLVPWRRLPARVAVALACLVFPFIKGSVNENVIIHDGACYLVGRSVAEVQRAENMTTSLTDPFI